jgi:hypothetical protein
MARISRLAERELGDLEDPDFDFEIGPVGIDYSSEKMWYLVSCLSWAGDDELGGDWYYVHNLRQLWCKDPWAKEDKQGWLKWNIKDLEALRLS